MADRAAASEIATRRDDHVVYVRPELVVEIALDGVQVSTRYPGGVALRFARVVRRYRPDKARPTPTRSTRCARCSRRDAQRSATSTACPPLIDTSLVELVRYTARRCPAAAQIGVSGRSASSTSTASPSFPGRPGSRRRSVARRLADHLRVGLVHLGGADLFGQPGGVDP